MFELSKFFKQDPKIRRSKEKATSHKKVKMENMSKDSVHGTTETPSTKFDEIAKESDEKSPDTLLGLVVKMARSEKFLLLLGILALVIDPLFFYIPVMKNNSSCLGLDKTLRVAAVTLRTLVDIIHDILWWCKSCRLPPRRSTKPRKVNNKPVTCVEILRRHYKWFKSCKISSADGRNSLPARGLAILASLPIPQVVVFVIGLKSHFKAWLKFGLLIQLLPRIFRTCPTYVAVTISSDQYKWIGAAINLVFYSFASHVLGSFWYLRAVERKMDCLEGLCNGTSGCDESTFYCQGENSIINNGFPLDVCSAQPTSNVTMPFNYGMYSDAIKSNLIGSTNFINKFSQSFWWGLHNLSSMGQDLESSDYIWDTCFAIFICIAGLILFALLIGNMQTYLESKMPAKLEKIKEKRKELKSWTPFYNLPEDLRRQVSMCRKHKWQEAIEVNLHTVLNDTPKELKKKLRKHLCKDLFSRVEDFEKLPIPIKDALRGRARARVFPENTIIVEEGKPIYEMLHIVHGKGLTYNKDEKFKWSINRLKANQCFGEQVLQTALESSQPILPIAKKTFQAVKKVEAFALSFDDFVDVFTQYGNLVPVYKEDWASRMITGAFRKKTALSEWKKTSQQTKVNSPRGKSNVKKDNSNNDLESGSSNP